MYAKPYQTLLGEQVFVSQQRSFLKFPTVTNEWVLHFNIVLKERLVLKLGQITSLLGNISLIFWMIASSSLTPWTEHESHAGCHLVLIAKDLPHKESKVTG
jgi:hypothetical protein